MAARQAHKHGHRRIVACERFDAGNHAFLHVCDVAHGCSKRVSESVKQPDKSRGLLGAPFSGEKQAPPASGGANSASFAAKDGEADGFLQVNDDVCRVDHMGSPSRFAGE